MDQINLNDVTQFVEENIGVFHQKRIAGLNQLKLKKVLTKKNPYLFKAKNIMSTEQIIKGITDAFISSQEETIFGEWLEKLAIFVNEKVYNGQKSSAKGIDLEFVHDNIRFIVSIKSGPNWGNASQVSKMKSDFTTAKKTLRTSNSKLNIIAVNGCCYGRDNNPDKGEYFKYCGQRFWEFISGDPDFFIKIIEPLGHRSKERNDEFWKAYHQKINLFDQEFKGIFMKNDGSIDWEKIVKFNSGIESYIL